MPQQCVQRQFATLQPLGYLAGQFPVVQSRQRMPTLVEIRGRQVLWLTGCRQLRDPLRRPPQLIATDQHQPSAMRRGGGSCVELPTGWLRRLLGMLESGSESPERTTVGPDIGQAGEPQILEAIGAVRHAMDGMPGGGKQLCQTQQLGLEVDDRPRFIAAETYALPAAKNVSR
jgi:hypothetical protein